jgi:hypothetical protein
MPAGDGVCFFSFLFAQANLQGFYINLPIGGLAAVVLLLINIPERFDKSNVKHNFKSTLSELDLFGFCLFAPFTIMLLLALEWGGIKYPWNSSTIIGLFCGSGATLVVFLTWEHYVGDKAMIPFSMVRKKIVWSSCLVIACFFGSLLTITYYLPIYFQTIKGVSPSQSGVDVLPGIFGQIVMALTSGILGQF